MAKLSDFVKPLNSPSTQLVAAVPDTARAVTNYTPTNNVELTLMYALPTTSNSGFTLNGVQLGDTGGVSGGQLNYLVFALGAGQTLTLDNGLGPAWASYILTAKKID